MSQNDLNRAVAAATGETVSEISHRGFQPLMAEPPEVSADDGAALRHESQHRLRGRASRREPVAA